MIRIYILIFSVILIILMSSCSSNRKFMTQDNSKLTMEQIGSDLKSFGISEKEARYIATEYAKRKWKEDPYFKILKCEKKDGVWTVVCFADDGLTGWGCRVLIDKQGCVIKDEFIPGL
jgi:hypothetical protein